MTIHAPTSTRLVYDFADGSRDIRSGVTGTLWTGAQPLRRAHP